MSDKEILIDDDDSFKELQVKWRNNSLADDEKDLYIKHLTLRHIDKKKSSRELQAENERLKKSLEVENQDFNNLHDLCEKVQAENERLGQRIKEYEDCLLAERNVSEHLREQYESTPERGLKAVMEFHNHFVFCKEGQPELMDRSEAPNPSPVGYYITAEDIG